MQYVNTSHIGFEYHNDVIVLIPLIIAYHVSLYSKDI